MMTKRILATFLGLALTSAFAFANEIQDNKELWATFKTDDGKQIRCLVHQDDHEVIRGMKGKDVVLSTGVKQAPISTPDCDMCAE
ncbi:hypothetical protein [Legionella yabuuchiae]|uniref:hypothetical protein n=1 Tax=Legionella yabuuchiae TaxID=376727 RepID=UPI001055DD04|nr:hypothetical protein [Legionella yabuuchiae]